MSLPRLGCIFATSLILAAPAESRQSPSVPTGEQAVLLLQSSFTALKGSASALPSSLVASGTITQFQGVSKEEYPLRLLMRDADKFRWELNSAGGVKAVVINHGEGQSQTTSGSKSLMPWEFAAKRLENFPMFLLSRWLSADGIQVRFVGQETIEGQVLSRISIVDVSQRLRPVNSWQRDASLGQYELYIDPTTSLPVRLRYYQETGDSTLSSLVLIDVVYSDFHSIGGSVFPLTLTRYMGTKKLSVIHLESTQPNGHVTDQDFAIRVKH